MPSLVHEALVDLFRRNADLAARLLEGRVDVPAYAEARLESGTIAELFTRGYATDAVVVLSDGAPKLGIAIEVQLSRDPEKRYTWPLYVAALHVRHRCPFALLVIAPDESVARWAARPLDFWPGSPLEPIVLGPSSIPRLLEGDEASFELRVLSAVIHGRGPRGVDVVLSALSAAMSLDESAAALYADVLITAIGSKLAAEVVQMVQNKPYEYQSEFMKKFVGAAREVARQDGRAEGLAEGREVGREEGRAEGRLTALRSSIDAVCAERGLALSADEQSRIRESADEDELERWFRRSLRAADPSEIFEPR